MSKRFATKQDADAAAEMFPLAGAVWIGPAMAAVERVPVGWYVGFPSNVSRRFLCEGDVERAEHSATRHISGWL